jgi:uncharacterized protein (TIRG00374 family)
MFIATERVPKDRTHREDRAMIKRNLWRWFGSLAIVLVILGLAFLQREEVALMIATVQNAHVAWLAVAIALQIVVYVMFAVVMHQSLVLVQRPLTLASIFPFSFTGIVLNRFIPAGGTAVEVIGLLNRGVPQGATTVVLSLNILSGIAAFGLMLVGGTAYQIAHGGLDLRGGLGLVGGIAVAALAIALIIRRARDREGLTRKALALQRGAGRLLRRSFAPEGMLHFIDETYDSVALIRTNAFGFIRLIGLHLTALLLDCVGLVLLFVALGYRPDFLLVLLGYSLAYVIATLSSLPGGGGSFEAAMALTYTQLGVPAHLALSVTLLYRLMTFWLPLLVVAFTANRIRMPRLQAASRVKRS